MRARASFRSAAGAEAEPRYGSTRALAGSTDELACKLARLTILLLPVNWILGTTLPWLYAAALVCLIRGRNHSVLEILFLWLIGALTLGLIVAIPGGIEADRAMASVYNMSVIVVLIAFLNAGLNFYASGEDVGRARLFKLSRQLFVFNALFIAAIFAVTKVTGQYALSMNTLVLGLLGHLPGVFGEYGRVDFSVTDWTVAGPENRVIGFGIYATEGALLFMLLGLLGAIEALAARRWWRWAAIEATIAVGLVAMASRTTLLAYLVSLLLLAVLQRGRMTKLVLLTAPVVLIGAVTILVFGRDAIGQWVAARNESRLGSSDTRFLSYSTAIDMVMRQNPLTGLGIKPRDDSLLQIPIGSHSTLVSMFTKGGFVALAVLATIYATLAAGILRVQILVGLAPLRDLDTSRRFELVQLSRCTLVILIWWFTEDFDAPAYEAAFAGLCFGLFWGALRHSRRLLNRVA